MKTFAKPVNIFTVYSKYLIKPATSRLVDIILCVVAPGYVLLFAFILPNAS